MFKYIIKLNTCNYIIIVCNNPVKLLFKLCRENMHNMDVLCLLP